MIGESKIIRLTDDHLKGTDKYIVDLQLKSNNIIQLYIDSDTAVSIEDCIALSRHLESNLNRDAEDFELNVSSAGLDQPFKIFKQYLKNVNKEVSVLLLDGQKFVGTLMEATENEIILGIPANKKKKIEKQELRFLINNIKETRSIISFKK
jgi:ribosome maturation factor RimP